LAVFSTGANFATVGEEKGENPVVAKFATTATKCILKEQT